VSRSSPEGHGPADGAVDAVRLEGVTRSYPSGAGEVSALRDVSCVVAPGASVAVTGPSGSGKSTLLNLIAGLERPSAGRVTVFGSRLDTMRDAAVTAFRARHLGFVFQDPHLLPALTALENVVAARLPWSSRRSLEPDARELLAAVGLAQRMDHPPGRLSGGERQRVGLARALLGRPRLLLADEPTGNLDAATTESLLELLERVRADFALAMIVATHDPAVAATADRAVRLVGGQIIGDRTIGPSASLDLMSLE
jgi:predicted ABC-type transport system involved in lysophospholipase L1 biosynthesis ATPase subunit